MNILNEGNAKQIMIIIIVEMAHCKTLVDFVHSKQK
jgi:hypothetical protein